MRFTGKLPAQRPHALADFAAYGTGRLPAPPGSFTAPNIANWGMLGNDTLGDCTIAGSAHVIMGNNGLFHERDRQPSSATVVKQYEQLTGGVDTGLVEADVLREWQRYGLFGGNKLAGYAPIPPKNFVDLQTAIAYFGGAYIGVQLPASAQLQFGANEPWTYVPGSPIEGGHCVYLCGYDATHFKCVTWGQLIDVAPTFLSHYMDEAWVLISHELVEAQKDSLGIDLKTLQDDLGKV